MKTEDRILFLKYAIPSTWKGHCSTPDFPLRSIPAQGPNTQIKEIKMSPEYIDQLIKTVSENKTPPEGAEDSYSFAMRMCEETRKKMNKKEIDADVIRRYFLFVHNTVVDQKHELRPDFDNIACKTYVGRVVEADGGWATVEIAALGRRKYKTILAKKQEIKKDDIVTVHYDYIAERINTELAREIQAANAAREDLKENSRIDRRRVKV